VRIPLSWLRELVAVDLPAEQVADILTLGGLEVEAIEHPTGGTRGVVVAEVLEVARIEGSDKLHLVRVTDGSDTHEVVAGASNFRPGDRVPAALPGAVLPGGFEVGRRKLFGHVSNGMLASPRELGVGDDHAGIWVLDADAPLGADVSTLLDLDDPVLVLEVTPDRGYGLSVAGVARDVAALTGATLTLPEADAAPAVGPSGVAVVVADPARCRRFDARRLEGLEPRPAPAWAQRRLAAAGMRPISALVDATNIAMLETGHPAHAYDLDRLAGPRLEVRYARAGERLVTLDGVERACDPDDLVIADADGPVGFAGVMGGERTEVGPATRTVVLEVASFDPRAVLRTARRHQLLTEASKRFEKTVPAETVAWGAARCAHYLVAFGGGAVTGRDDVYPGPRSRPVIHLRPARARSVLGLDLDDAEQGALLERIACTVERADGALAVVPPAYRPDLEIEADLFEELARLHGYDNVPETVPASGQAGGRTPEDEAVRAVRRALAGGGWTEVLVLPFIGEADLEALELAAGDRRRQTIALVNPLSKEESALRTTLLPGLVRALRRNVNRQVGDVAVFEVGRCFLTPTDADPGAPGSPPHVDVDEVPLPAEPLTLGFAACGQFEAPRHDRAARPVDVYDVLGAVDLVRRALGRPALEAVPTEERPFHSGRAARLRLEGRDVGVVGELHPRIVAAFEVPPRTVVGEVRLDRIVGGGAQPAQPLAPSALPRARFDVAVLVAESVPAAAVEAAVRAGAGTRLSECRLFDVFRGPQIGAGRKSLAYALRLDDPERQLTDDDVSAAIEGVAAAVTRRVGGELRR
jgi:phenylalanyl-tRNA synthetase beta chain